MVGVPCHTALLPSAALLSDTVTWHVTLCRQCPCPGNMSSGSRRAVKGWMRAHMAAQIVWASTSVHSRVALIPTILHLQARV